MTTLLHVSSSPRGDVSESRALAATFLSEYTDAHPEVDVVTLDLFTAGLPPFAQAGAGAKMASFAAADLSPEEATVWAEVRRLADQFLAADAYLFTVPMWNHGVPYVLKQWIDIITQPGILFGLDPQDGYSGLVLGKKAAVVYTSGVYRPGAPLAFGSDFHSAYFNDWLRYVGVTDVAEIRFQPTVLSATVDDDRRAAQEQARELAKRF